MAHTATTNVDNDGPTSKEICHQRQCEADHKTVDGQGAFYQLDKTGWVKLMYTKIIIYYGCKDNVMHFTVKCRFLIHNYKVCKYNLHT